ncbi:MAG: GntR family transcriptional regulator [Devosia sp.]|uniref:GntR family transcriptional regulator n=1 Tax=Devosia sp. XGJD_8 TaxID=3391187 RepID=UPI001E15EDAD|nr:GntR family transcriptional regulator [Alphaproteobacteria bacterium]MBU1561346.1 GntR family transcriptional regulator [Alphaproteobacteria bacterium]MBU2303890.1 GntR family transcriptional regulator [Alphaproteobacteria bacterium]MBU2366509.1 GntR family transcriptional regulator [Alphaproteobacteria bacterium]
MLKRPRTSAEDIRRQLAARIISGELAPGTPLDETGLAGEFAVSRTPIREALRLLAASGLIDQKPHARALVAKPDDATLAGMFEVMGYLEAICAGLSAIAMSAAERDALDALHIQMAAIVREGDHAAYADANEAFHSAIYDGAHNAYLSEVTRSTRQRLQPFRRAQFKALGRLSRSHAEHGVVVDAILQGDRTGAEAAMRQHIAIVEGAYGELSHG